MPDKPADYPHLALDAARAAAACGWSVAAWYAGDSRGAIPQSVQMSGCAKRVWPVDTLKLWLAHGCPSRDSATWQGLLETLRQEAGKT